MRHDRRRRHGKGSLLWLCAAAAAGVALYLGRRRARRWVASLAGALKEAALSALSDVFHDEAA